MSKEIENLIEQSFNIRPKSLLECLGCKHKLEREYKEKDYVNKNTEEKCPKCSSQMYIKAIYIIPFHLTKL